VSIVARSTTPAPDRFWPKVVQQGECWQWIGATMPNGYGRFGLGVKQAGTVLAHRWSYEHLVGPILGGLVIDHLCRNRACVNPQHMEPVTTAVNNARGVGPALFKERRTLTHCGRGHEFTPENTRTDKRGRRTCRACFRVYDRERKRRLRAAARGVI
jgi:hypothetical protein